jgi:hypothetical protein
MRRVILILLLVLGACNSVEDWNNKVSTAEERSFALSIIDATRQGNFGLIDARILPEYRPQLTPELFAKIRELAPPGKAVLQTVAVDTQSDGFASRTIKSFNYEIGGGKRWALFQVTILGPPGHLQLVGVHIYPLDRPPSSVNAFGSVDRGMIHYLWLAAMALALGTTLTALVLIVRTRGVRLKWLWALGCLMSFGLFQLNWTTGAWSVTPIGFVLFGAGAVQNGPLMPWIMQFAIPVVAIVFISLRFTGAFERRSDLDEDAEMFA